MEYWRSKWMAKRIVIIAMAFFIFRCASSETNHTVGGISGWDLTSDLRAWTSTTTFHVGDSLVFSYTPVHDLVEVDHDDYQSCTSSNPIITHNDGETVIQLTLRGTRYFICGRHGHCQMGLKVQVQVIASDDQSGPETHPSGSPTNPPRDDQSTPEVHQSGSSHSGSAPSNQPRACEVAAELFYFVMAMVIIPLILFGHFWINVVLL